MNISASKVLLGLSVAAYTYCTWDHLFSPKKADRPAPKTVVLTPAMVNRVEVLALRDPFESVPLDRTSASPDAATAVANMVASTAGGPPAALGAAQAGAVLSSLSLQGVFMTPSGHAALINGKPVTEGEAVALEEGGPKIRAKKIGEDFAIVETGGRMTTLRLEAPAATAAAASGGSSEAAPAAAAPARAAAPAAPAASTPGRSAAPDPYAGHKTHH